MNPDLIDAATDLGVIEAKSGRLREAAELATGHSNAHPARSSSRHEPGYRILRREAVRRKARMTVLRVLEFNPDMTAAKQALQALNRTPPNCGL